MLVGKEGEGIKGKPSIQATLNGPFLVKNLENLTNSKGQQLETKPVMALCRCGGSSSKLYCNGTHLKIGFRSNKLEGRLPDRLDNYAGRDIAIHDNRGVCSHSGFCTDNSPAVFSVDREPWIEPDAESPEKLARTIKMCPSGALSYTRDGVLYKDQEREPSILVSKDGPYYVVGGPELKDPEDSKPESKEQYTLCRCGGYKNKPFCDGKHWYIDFKDDKN
jgi:CDGSH-type Zn-finger protein